MTIRLMMKYEESPSSWSSWRWEIIPFWSGWALSRSLRNNLWWERWAMIITWKWSKIWIREMILYHFQPGEESRTIRILIISALWHISTALANLLTGYILQVAFAVKFNPWSWCLILIPFQYSKPLGMIFFIFDPNTLRQYTKLLGVMAVSASCCLMALLYVIFFMTQVSSLAVFVNAWNEGVNPTSLILYLIDMHPDTYK